MTVDVVLLYHRITEPGPGTRVTPEHFAAHLDVLAGVADVVPLAEHATSTTGSRPRVAVTFDDGYDDNATTAAALLDERGMTATFFVSSADRDDELWNDRIAHALLDGPSQTPFLDLEIDAQPLRVDVRSEAGRERALTASKRRLRGVPHEIPDTIASITRQTGHDPVACAQHRRVDDDEIRALATRHEVGAHGRSHVMLTAVDDDWLRDELEGSRSDLESVLGAPVRSVAYPYGGPRAYDDRVVDAARRAGFERACINVRGTAAGADAFRIPRQAVHDWDADEFAAELRSWLGNR